MLYRDSKELLGRKLTIIRKLNTNTATQSRFVRRRELRGLNRLLRERAVLIDELVTVNAKLQGDKHCQYSAELQAMAAAIEKEQKAALTACDQVLREALVEHRQIAAELNNIKVLRQAKGRYLQQWTVMAAGANFNARG
ncbi:hypothetical protein [Sporomusa termitida]|uniref:FlgN protein n=1 Tax=Sporomusa termitida TaxID=2377 RepID=A0A517DQX5_9FIRM|nr:hypothetical protein [Sporomusa termitida]QDR79751.1 hypothetical protein SPTER_10460 [Sporomusa termitida]